MSESIYKKLTGFLCILLAIIFLSLMKNHSNKNQSGQSEPKYDAYNTVHGTHILTDGCENEDKTKLNLFEETLDALFDGNMNEMSKKALFLNIFELSDCKVNGQKNVMDDIENK